MNNTTTPTAPAGPVQSLVLPDGIFHGIKEWDQIAKQRKAREYLETLPNSILFPVGMPKYKLRAGRIHSTCGCWQCVYCHRVIRARALRDVRGDRWQNAERSEPRGENND